MVKRVTLDLPDELHEQCKALADVERRSLHKQLIVLIERSVEDAKKYAEKAEKEGKPAFGYFMSLMDKKDK